MPSPSVRSGFEFEKLSKVLSQPRFLSFRSKAVLSGLLIDTFDLRTLRRRCIGTRISGDGPELDVLRVISRAFLIEDLSMNSFQALPSAPSGYLSRLVFPPQGNLAKSSRHVSDSDSRRRIGRCWKCEGGELAINIPLLYLPYSSSAVLSLRIGPKVIGSLR